MLGRLPEKFEETHKKEKFIDILLGYLLNIYFIAAFKNNLPFTLKKQDIDRSNKPTLHIFDYSGVP